MNNERLKNSSKQIQNGDKECSFEKISRQQKHHGDKISSIGTSKGILEIAKFGVYVTVPIVLMYVFANNSKNLQKFRGNFVLTFSLNRGSTSSRIRCKWDSLIPPVSKDIKRASKACKKREDRTMILNT
ncbi:hypothetical protein ACJRO7_020736 [Eucalyptus globulus]|uniref:Transmembrane protein n=1 Tax=Eucalyptus globulus TaxID=34317 RepID=A0ABD3KHH8_EUCGL